jgi:hypothetical protein
MPTTILSLSEGYQLTLQIADAALWLKSSRYAATMQVLSAGIDVTATVEEQIVSFNVALCPITAWVGIIVERNAAGEATSRRVVDMNVWDKRDSVAAGVVADFTATMARKFAERAALLPTF